MSEIGHNSGPATRVLLLRDKSEAITSRQKALLIQIGQLLWPKGNIGKDGRRLSNPMPRFLSNVEVDAETCCWNWRGSMQLNGYGAFPIDGKRRLAHRWIYSVLRGEIPDGLVVDHLCQNKRCVNFTHLEAVTQSVNVRRSLGKAIEIPSFLRKETLQ